MKIVINHDVKLGFYPIVDGHHVASISTPFAGSTDKIKKAVYDFFDEIQQQQADQADHDGNNYGLLFYRHGYDGKGQQETERYYLEKYNIYVF